LLEQEAQLSQKGRAMLLVDNFAVTESH